MDALSCLDSVSVLRFQNADFVKALSYNKLLADYELGEIVGEGSYGRVYKVLHKPTGLTRALKQIKLAEEGEDYSMQEIERQEKLIKMTENEWNVLKMLDHPGIVRLIDVYRSQHNFYIVTEFCEGYQLFDEVCKRDYLNEKDAAKVLLQMLKAINYCHKRNVCHRDIKTENVIIYGEDLQVKLIDFGLACQFDPKDGMDRRIGTLLYMAPELFVKAPYDEMSDIWAIGILLFMMLTGRVPYKQTETNRLVRLIKKGHYEKTELDNPDLNLSADVKNLVSSLLQVDPK